MPESHDDCDRVAFAESLHGHGHGHGVFILATSFGPRCEPESQSGHRAPGMDQTVSV